MPSHQTIEHPTFSQQAVADIPLALYIHIPWCVKKCPYCDFNSHTLPVNEQKPNSTQQQSPEFFAEYVTALIADIDSQLPYIQGREISSIFIGGGTPSLLPIDQYQRLFAHLNKVLPLAADIEVTMEANPGTLEHAPFAEYLAVGINRLSIGVQSFSDSKLQALGRIHNANQAQQAIKAAKQAGFERINVDLMHGLPQQSVTEALEDIRLAHAAGATHISWYQLTIEPNTVFYRNTPVLPDDDNLAQIEEQGSALLSQLGYRNYEVSAWVSANDTGSRHNINYWQFGDYLAIGAGAHGKITIADVSDSNETDALEQGIYRFSKSRLPKDYMSYKHYPKMVGLVPIATDEICGEFMLNVLRLTQGVDLSVYAARTGLQVAPILPIINQLQQQGLLENQADWIQPTALGRRYLNQVLHAFL
ncbi:radical SAM family heme chaperone HemW [Psychrobacter sp. FDAARGOS_221]|uniref:radical SAM family heme chaperone HemW n=1 Tax=Psychrobacter sp. FDAARGOS_221 TaxID=1975705 RepID=UPI000BB56DED|nr:radical SAM family heme chaperone HemW [Psychrobacter sp. FDAARGOS_221]PNK61801.1 radical SAM protein [Psychrobacter sp. FDAARGOS_221]